MQLTTQRGVRILRASKTPVCQGGARTRVRFVHQDLTCSSTSAAAEVTVHFKMHDVRVQAAPGESLLEVSSRANFGIPTGCLTGSCGTCEVELKKRGSGSQVVRACMTSIPNDCKFIEIDELVDAVWGCDGFDL